MTTNSIDAAVDGFIVTVTKDGQLNASKVFYQGKEIAVCEQMHNAFPEGKYFTKLQAAKQLSPGVYCLTQ
jgi:hypothetical protein